MINFFPSLPIILPKYRSFSVVAVASENGAHGVGICPCAARRHLLGLPCLGRIRYYTVDHSKWYLELTSTGWSVNGGKRLFVKPQGGKFEAKVVSV